MTTTTKKFRKGDAVTLLMNWDRKGTVQIRDLTVHSCGAKQMVLVDDAGRKFAGSFFKPDESTINTRIASRLSQADADAAALAFAAEILTHERAHFTRCLAMTGTSAAYQHAIERDLAALHEPRALRKEAA